MRLDGREKISRERGETLIRRKARATIEREVIYVSGVFKVRAAKPLSGKRARCCEEVE